ncbi:hypothetical protein VTN49DRAFT_2825 [Thermomyces lanuginosus]|uniref:uncharacterized protein n=1 Tax=Thermomyces lanuginosus TaxID=5541 RepID=UPI003742FCEA
MNSTDFLGHNYTYIYGYSRGLNGVNIRRDVLITRIICGFLGLVAVAVLLHRMYDLGAAYIRHVSCLGATPRAQTFWSVEERGWWPKIKRHVLYAPLFTRRHHREFQLSSAVNMGTLPSRLQTTLLAIYLLSQVAYCTLLDYDVNEKRALIAELRGRSGNLAVLNMVPLFIFAGRNNILIWLLGVSFDTYNLFHRWLGRIVAVETVVHVIAWFINASDEVSLSDAFFRIRTTPFFAWGAVGTVAMILLISHSPSPIRHAFYETFLHLHQLFALTALVGVYIHARIDVLPQRYWACLAMALWAFERSLRWIRRFYLNFHRGKMTTVLIRAMPGEACRVTFHLPRRVHIKPGSHVYAFFPTVSWWMSHPFSVAWVDPESCVTPPAHPADMIQSDLERYGSILNRSRSEKQGSTGMYQRELLDKHQTSVSLVVAARSGMTRKLYNKALTCPKGILRTVGYIEGPYSSSECPMGSYGTAILFSGGAGITHHMLYVRDLLLRADDGYVATQRIYLIWAIRHTDCLNWVREWMDQILRLPNRRQILTIMLFVSKPRHRYEIKSPSDTVQMFPGRCRPDVVLREALPNRIGATIVSVCGPGAFADDVRSAARMHMDQGIAIDFVEESFTW